MSPTLRASRPGRLRPGSTGGTARRPGELWYGVLALSAGFGVQVGLFSFIRRAIRERRAAATGSVAVSGGISTGSMAACCVHHLGAVLPLLGLSGRAGFLVRV